MPQWTKHPTQRTAKKHLSGSVEYSASLIKICDR
jgi:hypothetical protein